MSRLMMSHSGGTTAIGINLYEECPQKMKHKLDGWKTIDRPHYFIVGGHFHKMCELGYLNQIDVRPDEYLIKEVPSEYQTLIKQMYDEFMLYPYDVTSTEKKLTVPLTNPVTGKVEEDDVFLTGRVDIMENLTANITTYPDGTKLIEENPNGQLLNNVLSDIKTTGSSTPPSIEQYRNQLVRYSYLKYLETGIVTKHISAIVVTKKESKVLKSGKMGVGPKRFRLIAEISEEDYLVSYLEALRVAREIRAGNFYQKPSACVGKWFECDFKPLCFPYRFANAQHAITSTLVKDKSLWEDTSVEIEEKTLDNVLNF